VQKISKKIYFTADNVKNMLEEFRDRITKKRDIINKTKLRCKEYALRDIMVICDRCKADVAPLKTFDYISPDLHYAKCVFGTLRKVDADEAISHADYEADREFVELYMALNNDEIANSNATELEEFAFCECRNKHIVGIIKGQKYFITDISQV
jgi:hypothetical protein